LLGAAIPLILSLYWVFFWLAPERMGEPLRVSVAGCSLLLGLFWYRARLSHAEVLLFRVLLVVAVLWLIPTLMATERNHAFAGWIKLLVLFTVCCFMARGLRHPLTAHTFGLALVAGACLLSAFILFIYVRHMGFTMPTYKTAREFKAIAQESGAPLNTIAFEAVFGYLMGLCVLPANRLLVILGIPIVLISSMFTGSRAPVAIMGASVFVLLCCNGLRSKSVRLRMTTLGVAFIAVFGLFLAVSSASDEELNHLSEGRTHIWSAGIDKFLERPLFGFGYESWGDDLVSRLPGESALTFDLAKNLAGGYHNEYISVLAEEGLIGAVGAFTFLWLLLRSSWLVAFREWATMRSRQWILFAAIFLVLRANFEVPGLFGYGQDPVDYLAYLFVAIVLSRFSVEEDYARFVALSRTEGVA
jgi:O-antigen ligase